MISVKSASNSSLAYTSLSCNSGDLIFTIFCSTAMIKTSNKRLRESLFDIGFGVSKSHWKMKLVVFTEVKAIIVCCSCSSSKTASQTLSLSMTYYINYFCGMVELIYIIFSINGICIIKINKKQMWLKK